MPAVPQASLPDLINSFAAERANTHCYVPKCSRKLVKRVKAIITAKGDYIWNEMFKNHIQVWLLVHKPLPMGSVATLQIPGLWFVLGVLFVHTSTCSDHVYVGFLWVLWFPPTIPKHANSWFDYAKLTHVVYVCMHGGL